LLLQYNGDEDQKPVAHESEEVLENVEEIIAVSDSTDEVHGDDDANPKIIGDSLAKPA